ncbi:Secreted protein [Magnetospirillum sp. LM-5]|uniref:hypothetical protein n=1 Tax=Magnetospirillum sp. LM-5 TaxID=2681466 RepID=UPI00137EE927|nr:hypothetical protein [Magnetospirillum sp. LM-5]CAA7618613.1 Secreted protein [Magnetospirillum sp. LM-5]
MIRSIAVATAMLALAACADRPWPNAEMSGDSPAHFNFRSDDQHALATVAAAEQGKPVTWKVSDRTYGSVIPAATQYADRAGRPCRGLKQERTGWTTRDVTACKGADGIWVVSEYSPDKAD